MRYRIEDIKGLERHLNELGARVLYPYEFTDYYFKPVEGDWNPLEKNLRIREWKEPANPTTIYFARNQIVSLGEIRFKRAVYRQGKVPLFTGDLDTCNSLLNDLGFEPWLVVEKKRAKLWEVSRHQFNTAIEYIDPLGWTGELEFEGTDPEKAMKEIEDALKVLGVPRDSVSFKPISAILAERPGIQ